MNKLQCGLAASVIALAFASCSETNKQENTTNNKDTMVLQKDNQPATPKAEDAWARVDWNAPVVKYEEVKSSDVNVRGNEQFGIYGLGENVLFETGKADIRANAHANLDQIVASINKHYNGGQVKVYGFTDAQGTADANAALSRQRAEAVKNYLVSNGKLAADRVSMYAEGESHPVASNDNAAGRQQNRRVEIVAMKP